MSERTEAPTSKRLSEARSEGRVVRSQELNAALSLLIGTLLLRGPGKGLLTAIEQAMAYQLSHLPTEDISTATIGGLFQSAFSPILPGTAAIVVGLAVTGIVASVGQSGFVWASKRVGLDLSRLNPLPGFQRMFSKHGLMELFKSLVKLALVSYIVYAYLSSRTADLMQLAQMDVFAGIHVWAGMAVDLALRVSQVYLIVAAADYAYQRRQHTQQLKMTKEEVKEEFKQQEGDPFLKGRIRNQQRRMARMRMMANVKKADVVVINPTHFAVALHYDPASMTAPVVLAKGQNLVAQKIVELARENGIPVIQNIPLARGLYKMVEIDQQIPADLYVAVAELLSTVYRMRGHNPVASPA